MRDAACVIMLRSDVGREIAGENIGKAQEARAVTGEPRDQALPVLDILEDARGVHDIEVQSPRQRVAKRGAALAGENLATYASNALDIDHGIADAPHRF